MHGSTAHGIGNYARSCGPQPVTDSSPAYWLAVMTGMRRNELLGLRWTDLDMTWSWMPPPGVMARSRHQ